MHLYTQIVALLTLGLAVLGTPVAPSGNKWFDLWTAAPQSLNNNAVLPGAPYVQNGVNFASTTIRQTVRMSQGASTIRIRLSNAYSTPGVIISAMSYAVVAPNAFQPGGSSIQPSTVLPITFTGGNASVYLAPGDEGVSDPIKTNVLAGASITLSMYLQYGQYNYPTGHGIASATTYFAAGNQINAASLTNPASTVSFYYISGVEGFLDNSYGTLVCFGDSITDGFTTPVNTNTRFPDQLANILVGGGKNPKINVVNEGIGANLFLSDGVGYAGVSRYDRDALARSGVKYVTLLEGVNDINGAATDAGTQQTLGDWLIQNYQLFITRSHALGLPVFMGTITPFSPPGQVVATREATRQRLNTWIRTSGKPDYVVDYDAVLRDPNQPASMQASLQSGDYLHPSVSGYQAMANAWDTTIFAKLSGGVDGYTRK